MLEMPYFIYTLERFSIIYGRWIWIFVLVLDAAFLLLSALHRDRDDKRHTSVIVSILFMFTIYGTTNKYILSGKTDVLQMMYHIMECVATFVLFSATCLKNRKRIFRASLIVGGVSLLLTGIVAAWVKQ
jgi:hypothetical protein